MSALSKLREFVAAHERQRIEKLDAEMSSWLFDPNPERFGRVIRTKLIEQPGQAYIIPGSMWADGKARIATGINTRVDEAAIEWPDA